MTAAFVYPFVAPGVPDRVRRALLCTLVDDGLPGAVLCGGAATDASAVLRAFLAVADFGVHRVPHGSDTAALTGGLDLQRSLAEGRPVRTAGLLARARGGALVADGLDRMASWRRAWLRPFVESAAPSSRFYATAGRRDERLAAFLDAVPFWLDLDTTEVTGEARRWRHVHDVRPEDVAERFRDATRDVLDRVRDARGALRGVRLGATALDDLVEAARARRVPGHRAQLFAARAARAHAALRGDARVDPEDVAFAIAVVVAPRGSEVEAAAPPPPASSAPPPPTEVAPSSETDRSARADGRVPDRVFEVADAAAPEAGASPASRTRTGGGGTRVWSWERGAAARTLARPARGRRLALAETLKRAALARPRRPGRPGLALDVRPSDIRVRRFRRRAGSLFVFVVDASGSMARHRMREAKGAVMRLLRDAYLRRDAVALISFRGDGAELLLPPTSSVVRAKRRLEVLPTGGGTPLADALVLLLEVATRERHGRDRAVVPFLVTDGRANVPRSPAEAGADRRRRVADELAELAPVVRRELTDLLVIDTGAELGGPDAAGELAARLGARVYRMPRLPAGSLADLAGDARTTFEEPETERET